MRARQLHHFSSWVSAFERGPFLLIQQQNNAKPRVPRKIITRTDLANSWQAIPVKSSKRKDKQISTKKKIKDCHVVKSIAVSLVLIGVKLMRFQMRYVKAGGRSDFEGKNRESFSGEIFSGEELMHEKRFLGE